MAYMELQSKKTIGDIAEELGISKTTVSRAMSGKGRISEATRQKVMDCVKQNEYIPNPMAKGLADSRTYNVGWIVPGSSSMTELPFFQRSMVGVSEVAQANDYDILISLVYDNDASQLRRLIDNNKVDGVILGRTLVNDKNVKLLQESQMPFVVIGSSYEDGVIQIDNDHIKACKELTSILILKGHRNIALIGGSEAHVVNQTRLAGFTQGMTEMGLTVGETNVFMNNDTPAEVERALDEAMKNGAQCIICMDDKICRDALDKLAREEISIPDDIKIASFYNSNLLENNNPPITALQYDPKELGVVACRTLLDLLDGKPVEPKVLLGYEVTLKGSTR